MHLKKEIYPHPNKWVRFLDNFLLVVAVFGPLVLIPQVLKVYTTQNVVGLSLFTWLFMTAGSVPWVIYGMVHKEKPIIIAYSLIFVFHALVLAGIFIYG